MLCFSGFELYSRWVPCKVRFHAQYHDSTLFIAGTKNKSNASPLRISATRFLTMYLESQI